MVANFHGMIPNIGCTMANREGSQDSRPDQLVFGAGGETHVVGVVILFESGLHFAPDYL